MGAGHNTRYVRKSSWSADFLFTSIYLVHDWNGSLPSKAFVGYKPQLSMLSKVFIGENPFYTEVLISFHLEKPDF